MGTALLILSSALVGLGIYVAYLIGFSQGEKKAQGELGTGEIESYAGLLESMSRLAGTARQEDDFYLESLTRILQANTETIRPEIILDIKHGEAICVSPHGQQGEWVHHALDLLQTQNPIWAEGDDRLASALHTRGASPLLIAFHNDADTRLIVQFYPQWDAQKKSTQRLYFMRLFQVVADIRARSLSSAYYERAARRLQEDNTRMKQLFSNVQHNLGNALSGVMTGLGAIHGLAKGGTADPDRAIEILRSTVLPNYDVANQMVAQMYDSISVVMEEEKFQELEIYQLSVLFERYFGTWLSEQGRRLFPDVEITWDIPEGFNIRTSDLVFFQVIWNVLKNAIKYTQEGSIRISAFQGDDDRLYLQVKDTGPGIPEAHQSNIGQYGFRGDQEGRAVGEGIGLWGAYRLVEAVDGHIYFRSRPGVGTEFNIGFLAGSPGSLVGKDSI